MRAQRFQVIDESSLRCALFRRCRYGNCEQQEITGETTTDTDTPPGGDGYFYLVTAENRVDEEGTKGTDGEG